MYLINGCCGSSGINLVWILVITHLRKGMWQLREERLISDLFSADFHKHYDNKSSKWLSRLAVKALGFSCTKLLLTEIWIWKWSWQLWTLLKQWWEYCWAWKKFRPVWDLHPWIHMSWVTSHGFKIPYRPEFFSAFIFTTTYF